MEGTTEHHRFLNLYHLVLSHSSMIYVGCGQGVWYDMFMFFSLCLACQFYVYDMCDLLSVLALLYDVM